MDAGTVFYAKCDGAYVLKFVGDVRYTLGCSLSDFLDRLFAREDFDAILLDLTETRSIDSTSLGLLARIANFVRERFGGKVTLFSTNDDVNELLDSVGFFQIFNVCGEHGPIAEADRPMPVTEHSEAELARTLYEAHACLCELNEKNREMFRSVLEALKGEL